MLQTQLFPAAGLMPGVPALLRTLLASAPASHPGERVHIALATSSAAYAYELKTARHERLFALFPPARRVLGDDPRIRAGHGKPAPDIYRLALETINAGQRAAGAPEIAPAECLVFEDAVTGVEAARRAGMRVVWVPHPGLLGVVRGSEARVLAGS